MPIDVFAPMQALDGSKVPQLADALTATLLRWTDAADNEFFRSNVSVFVQRLPDAAVFAGGKHAAVVRVDVKVPSVALSTQERRSGFTADATELVRNAASMDLDHVWVFISNAVDGGWGIDGRALTTDDME